jgi:hypothetical protein
VVAVVEATLAVAISEEVAAILVVATLEVAAATGAAERVLAVRISVALVWECLGSVPLTSAVETSAASRAAISLTLMPREFTH